MKKMKVFLVGVCTIGFPFFNDDKIKEVSIHMTSRRNTTSWLERAPLDIHDFSDDKLVNPMIRTR